MTSQLSSRNRRNCTEPSGIKEDGEATICQPQNHDRSNIERQSSRRFKLLCVIPHQGVKDNHIRILKIVQTRFIKYCGTTDTIHAAPLKEICEKYSPFYLAFLGLENVFDVYYANSSDMHIALPQSRFEALLLHQKQSIATTSGKRSLTISLCPCY